MQQNVLRAVGQAFAFCIAGLKAVKYSCNHKRPDKKMIDEKYGSKTTNDKHNKFYRVGQWPLNHVVAGGDDDSLVQNIEGGKQLCWYTRGTGY